MKPLSLEETRLKEEMKGICLSQGKYIDNNAEAKFKMLCHLEDFEIECWKLQHEKQQLRIQISAREEEYKKLEDNWNKLKTFLEDNWKETQDIWFVKIINEMEDLERGTNNE